MRSADTTHFCRVSSQLCDAVRYVVSRELLVSHRSELLFIFEIRVSRCAWCHKNSYSTLNGSHLMLGLLPISKAAKSAPTQQPRERSMEETLTSHHTITFVIVTQPVIGSKDSVYQVPFHESSYP